jgi:GGDEF domain-containing protein
LNQKVFQDSLADILRSHPAGREVALIWIDLVNLRREFSLWGWSATEALACRVAGTLRSVLDQDALVGRVGDSSFLVAMEASRLDKNGRRRIQAVVDALTPLRRHGSESIPEVAAGVAFFPSDTDSSEDLVRFASLAATRATMSRVRT